MKDYRYPIILRITLYTMPDLQKHLRVWHRRITSYNVCYTKLLRIYEYDDTQIANFFTKKKEDAVIFIKNVGVDLIESRIRPFIERIV